MQRVELRYGVHGCEGGSVYVCDFIIMLRCLPLAFCYAECKFLLQPVKYIWFQEVVWRIDMYHHNCEKLLKGSNGCSSKIFNKGPRR